MCGTPSRQTLERLFSLPLKWIIFSLGRRHKDVSQTNIVPTFWPALGPRTRPTSRSGCVEVVTSVPVSCPFTHH